MKTFDQLNETEKKEALSLAFNGILEAVLEGAIRFNDKLNQDDLQKRIDKAIAKADRMQTPWFAHEYLLDDAKVKAELEGMAQTNAEDAIYRDRTEACVVTLKGESK